MVQRGDKLINQYQCCNIKLKIILGYIKTIYSLNVALTNCATVNYLQIDLYLVKRKELRIVDSSYHYAVVSVHGRDDL